MPSERKGVPPPSSSTPRLFPKDVKYLPFAFHMEGSGTTYTCLKTFFLRPNLDLIEFTYLTVTILRLLSQNKLKKNSFFFSFSVVFGTVQLQNNFNISL